MQYIIICIKDSDPNGDPKDRKTYIQCSRKRYLDYDAAAYRASAIAHSRNAVVVPVPDVMIDEDGYPTDKEQKYELYGNAPDAVVKAFNHVKSYIRETEYVIYDGVFKWLYADSEMKGVDFKQYPIDISLLEDAADSLENVPAIFQVVSQDND